MKNEFARTEMKDVNLLANESYKDIKPHKPLSVKELNDAIKDAYDKIINEINPKEAAEGKENEGLTDKEKKQIKEEQHWSDEIINHIENWEQYEIYKKADLHEEEVNGRKCLVKNINMDYVDPKTGMTNRERMEKGWSPIDEKTGEKIELHHMNQDYNAPFAELCERTEHGDGNHSTLHPKSENSWRNNPELNKQYNNVDKPDHWKERSKEGM